jgi:hypothetical protein
MNRLVLKIKVRVAENLKANIGFKVADKKTKELFSI